MSDKIHTLPDDIEQLKNIISTLNQQYLTLDKKFHELNHEYESLNQKYQLIHKMQFGKKSEKLKLDPEDELQGRLFNEAENSSAENESSDDSTEETPEADADEDVTIIKQHTRKKPGRKPIGANVPRVEIIHDLSDNEKKCECCQKERPLIGKEETEELVFIPAKVYAEKHITFKYGPCTCEKFQQEEKPEIISAPARLRMLPRTIASENLLAFTITSKFCDSMPFYRLSNMLERFEISIPRATLSNWQIGAFNRLEPLFDIMKETIKSGEFIRMDETTVQVLHEENRSAESKSYMWVAIGYPARGRPLVLFEYHPTRAGYVPMKFLEGFKGYLQTDGYAAYNKPAHVYGLVHVGCFAHARREFFEAYDSKKKNRAHKILLLIRKIYSIEDDLRLRSLPDDVFVEKRRLEVTPVLDELHSYLVETKAVVVPSSNLGKAVNYTLNEWHKLVRYLDLACMTPDNNEIERAIKSFAVGRKNWMFANTPSGAHSSAGMYSLIQSAKANGLEPYAYLCFLFSKFPKVCNDRNELKKLLPCFLSPEDLKIKE